MLLDERRQQGAPRAPTESPSPSGSTATAPDGLSCAHERTRGEGGVSSRDQRARAAGRGDRSTDLTMIWSWPSASTDKDQVVPRRARPAFGRTVEARTSTSTTRRFQIRDPAVAKEFFRWLLTQTKFELDRRTQRRWRSASCVGSSPSRRRPACRLCAQRDPTRPGPSRPVHPGDAVPPFRVRGDGGAARRGPPLSAPLGEVDRVQPSANGSLACEEVEDRRPDLPPRNCSTA